MKTLLLLLVGLFMPLLTWANEPIIPAQQLGQVIKQVMNNPLTKYGFKVYSRASAEDCAPAFSFPVGNNQGKAQLCEDRLTKSRHFKIVLDECYEINSIDPATEKLLAAEAANNSTLFFANRTKASKHIAELSSTKAAHSMAIFELKGCNVNIDNLNSNFALNTWRLLRFAETL
jgi:hypothetical protein